MIAHIEESCREKNERLLGEYLFLKEQGRASSARGREIEDELIKSNKGFIIKKTQKYWGRLLRITQTEYPFNEALSVADEGVLSGIRKYFQREGRYSFPSCMECGIRAAIKTLRNKDKIKTGPLVVEPAHRDSNPFNLLVCQEARERATELLEDMLFFLADDKDPWLLEVLLDKEANPLKTFKEIAKEFKITRQNAQQLHARAKLIMQGNFQHDYDYFLKNT